MTARIHRSPNEDRVASAGAEDFSQHAPVDRLEVIVHDYQRR